MAQAWDSKPSRLKKGFVSTGLKKKVSDGTAVRHPVETLAMFNLNKYAKQAENYEAQLQAQNKTDDLTVDGLSIGDKQLEGVRDNSDLIDTTEVQMDNGRGKLANSVTEEQLDNGKTTLTTLRNNDNETLGATPLAVLNQKQDKDRLDAYRAANKGVRRDTEFWDKFVDDMLEEPTKMLNRMGPSQLANNPDRFHGDTVDKMVMASLQDADAMLLHIFYKAASNHRDLNAEEQKLVDGITQDKITILSQMAIPHTQPVGQPETQPQQSSFNPAHAAQRVRQLHELLSKIDNTGHPDGEDVERMRSEYHELLEQLRPHVGA